jgi:hypothetical protein
MYGSTQSEPKQGSVLFESTLANEITLVDSYKKASSKCCIDRLSSHRFSDGMRRPVSGGMRYAPNGRRARSATETRPAMKKTHCAGIPQRHFQAAKADHRFGSGRSLVVLLCFGGSRPSHFGIKTADDAGGDEADLWKDTAESPGTGDRNTFPLGEPAAQ